MEKNKAADKTPSRLGRGLSALIPPMAPAHPAAPVGAYAAPAPAPTPEGVQEIALAAIVTNPHQPRTTFDEAAIADLTESVKRHGVLQPVMVRPRGGGRYELVAGERRYRAAKDAGLTRIPVVVRSLTDEESLTVALIENIQREDLNPIEAARAYRQLMEDFGLTQTQLGEQIGKKQSTISNAMRLLELPSEIQESIAVGQITMEHGKVLLSATDKEKQWEIWQEAMTLSYSVKQTQKEVDFANFLSPLKKKGVTRKAPAQNDLHWDDLLHRVRLALSMKVSVKHKSKGGGTLMIEFSSPEDVEAVLDKLQGN